MKTLFTFTLCLFVLTGCAHTAFGRTDLAKRAKTEMIGMSKVDLLLCAGVPDRSQKLEGMEFIAYDSQSVYGGNGDVTTRHCEATFVLVDGVVERISYTGSTGGLFTKDHQCGHIIKNCLQ